MYTLDAIHSSVYDVHMMTSHETAALAVISEKMEELRELRSKRRPTQFDRHMIGEKDRFLQGMIDMFMRLASIDAMSALMDRIRTETADRES